MRAVIERMRDSIVSVTVCVALSFLVLLQSPMSPFGCGILGTDSGVFSYIGAGMLEGKVPYLDMFDHKGPLLYFINCVGQAIPHGTWLIELLFMSIAMYLVFASARELDRRSSCIVSSAAALFYLENTLRGGNYAEEYAMPFIAAGLLIFIRIIARGSARTWEPLACGACLGACLMLKPTVVGMWIGMPAVVIFWLIRERRARDLMRCIGLFIAGVAAAVLPFAAAYASAGALDDLVRAYIVFNGEYAANWGEAHPAQSLIESLLLFPGAYLLPIAYAVRAAGIGNAGNGGDGARIAGGGNVAGDAYGACVAGNGSGSDRSRIAYAGIFLSSAICIAITLFNKHMFFPYWIYQMPLASIAAALIAAGFEGKPVAKIAALAGTVVAAGGMYPIVGVSMAMNGGMLKPEMARFADVASDLSADMDDGATLAVFGNCDWFYLETGAKCPTKYSYCYPLISASQRIREDYMRELEEEPPDYVLWWPYEGEVDDPAWEDLAGFLDSHGYEMIRSGEFNDGRGSVYRRS
jgi:hypothetical protein